MNNSSISEQIRLYAASIGFDACGFSKAESIGTEREHLKAWLDKGYNAGMDYLSRNLDKRCDPTLLVEGAKTIISVALNYYPAKKQSPSNPQIAYYAYGKDYHDIVKVKLQQLLDYIRTLLPNVTGRAFCDTAPVMERYWAAKSGIGFIGKNSLLIIPQKGSYFFLGEIIIDAELKYDEPISLSCGNCTRCLDACPTNAFEDKYILDSGKCISYQTIENKGEIDKHIIPLLNNRFYGCDICQQVCPWNRFSKPHNTPEFNPSDELLFLTQDQLDNLTETEYQWIFKGSAMKRAKLWGLQRNAKAIKKKDGFDSQ